MPESKDPERGGLSSSATSTILPSGLEVELGTPKHSFPSSSRSSSHIPSHSSVASIESDPLVSLVEALARVGDQETAGERVIRPYLTRTATSIGTAGSRLPDFEVDFEPDDAENPRNWPLWYKGLVIASLSFATWTIVFYSTSYTSGMLGMMEEFGASNESLTTLGVTAYLFGLAVGCLLMAPISEIYGRRPLYTVALLLSFFLVIPCALATSLLEIIVLRFFGAVVGGAMISIAPGTVSDISDETHRALAFSIWSIGSMNGPITGPLIGGFAYQYLGWRWTNWLVVIFAGVAWGTMSLIKESYAPTILRKKAAQRRKETGDERWWCRYDQKMSAMQALKVNLSRPFVLTFSEPILWFWDLYIAVVYGILYLCFVAYPLIFSGIRGWSPGYSGLAFAGVGVGTMLAIGFEPLIRKVINAHKRDSETGKVPPEASISILCVAAFMAPIGQLIFAWTSVPASIHWIWSILAGVPFGAGNTLVFIYGASYIASSYGIYSASALAGNAVVRYFIGGVLPLAGPAMYGALTPQWAGTLLVFAEVLLIPIPFAFYRWGKSIRMRSTIISQLRADQERAEGKSRARNGESRGGSNGAARGSGSEGDFKKDAGTGEDATEGRTPSVMEKI